ncbi:MAG TPA: hypothetical protein VE907_23405 [Gammaproteobacteria bacterium]|nr:hypothetical protein [Gammaproteobacteria bacterium]
MSPHWQHSLLLGVGFGLVHAFDADHLATIGGLAINNRRLTPAGYALRWALGHGISLGLVAIAALGLGFAQVVDWTLYGEFVVCAALLMIGTQGLLAARRSTVREHGQSAPRAHVHLFAPFHTHGRSGRAGVALGMVHGSAGSAAVLALLPLSRLHGGFANALYLFSFSAGVALGALAFATVFAAFARRSLAAGARITRGFQAAVGALAIASGAWLFLEIAYGSS